jgi:hypothetical protein
MPYRDAKKKIFLMVLMAKGLLAVQYNPVFVAAEFSY